MGAPNINNNTHFLSKNLQRNGHLRGENFEENIKIEQISSGDQIAYIKIREPLPSIVKPQYQRRTQFQKFFLQSYPDFFRQYCMCMHSKVDKDDPNSVSGLANGNHNDKYGANSFLLNHTQIIPITVHPTKYEYASQLKSPNLDDRKLQMEELNRRNAQQNELEKVFIENDGLSIKSQKMTVNTPKKGANGKEEKDSDDDDVSIGISDGKRPCSHASTATAKSLLDEANSPAMDCRSKSAYSIGQSSLDEISSPKSHEPSENLEAENDAIDTSLEHIQNENNEKIAAEETKSNITSSMVVDIDAIDGAEQTEEIIIQTQPEQLLDSPYISTPKKCAIDDNEPRSDSDSISLKSTEETSSDYLALRENTAKSAIVPICEPKVINKPTPKLRSPITSRRNKIAPVKAYPFPQTLRPFDKPREGSNQCLSQLDSQSWEVTMNGLQNFVRLIRHHPDTVESHFHAYCVALAKQVKNLRSQVSRSACQASAEFFQTHAKHLETECEDLATQLLNRTADTNKFLRANASRALASMCDNVLPTKVIQVFLTRGATHQNAIVRTATANLCSRIVSRVGCDKIFSMHREYRDKLIIAGANFLMEGSLDTRNNAKAFFKQLSTHPNYNRILKDVIPQRIYRNIEKALKSIK